MAESFKETSAELGKQLLPIVNKVLSKIIDLIAWFNNLTGGQKLLIVLGNRNFRTTIDNNWNFSWSDDCFIGCNRNSNITIVGNNRCSNNYSYNFN